MKSEIPTSFYMIPAGNGQQTRLTISTELKGRNVVEGFIAKTILQKVYRAELELIEKAAIARASGPSV